MSDGSVMYRFGVLTSRYSRFVSHAGTMSRTKKLAKSRCGSGKHSGVGLAQDPERTRGGRGPDYHPFRESPHVETDQPSGPSTTMPLWTTY